MGACAGEGLAGGRPPRDRPHQKASPGERGLSDQTFRNDAAHPRRPAAAGQSAESSKEARTSSLPRPAANIINPAVPKRNSPAQAPGHTVFAIQYAIIGGLRRGRSRRGRLGGTGLSSRGGSLQGLLLWRSSSSRGACAGEGLAGGGPRETGLTKKLHRASGGYLTKHSGMMLPIHAGPQLPGNPPNLQKRRALLLFRAQLQTL